MSRAEASFLGRDGGTHGSGGAGGAQWARLLSRTRASCGDWSGVTQGRPQRTLAANQVRAKKQKQSGNPVASAPVNSGAVAQRTRRNETIRQNIIRRDISVAAGGFRVGGFGCGVEGSALALLHQAACHHGLSVLVEPLIEKLSGVSEAGELVGLQSVARRGEKEVPGSLGARLGHENLQGPGDRAYRVYSNSKVITVSSNTEMASLWKGVEKAEARLGCCSGCAGDYEDPDRSAWEEDVEDEEVEEAKEVKEVREKPKQ
jgi:hypothetical protein